MRRAEITSSRAEMESEPPRAQEAHRAVRGRAGGPWFLQEPPAPDLGLPGRPGAGSLALVLGGLDLSADEGGHHGGPGGRGITRQVRAQLAVTTACQRPSGATNLSQEDRTRPGSWGSARQVAIWASVGWMGGLDLPLIL